jgi:hypothetical protein
VRSFVLEILRDGPSQNQLLSPLTKYLALCGEHAVTALSLPFEHAQWLARSGGLAYRDSERTRQLQVADVAATLGKVLEQIPGFAAELTRCQALPRDDGAGAPVPTVHLRLVLNANELALLPFELALAPAGSPAAGQPLCLQTEVPLCMTREIRRAASSEVQWVQKSKRRVLFAFADTCAPVPYEAHLLALRRAVEPWVEPPDDEQADPRARHRALSEHLVVLPRASVKALAEHCASGAFTHVHLLAHGIPYETGADRRFGLALHDSVDPDRPDVVEPERLAAALRPHQHDRSQTLARPLVVSLASCDSANAGTVVGPGASIAHELHLKGVPLVVASQFPLSFPGSVYFVSLLYEGLLWGQDPRCVLDDLRRQMRTLLPDNHDWASIVAYASLPPDIAEQSQRLAFLRARDCINAALGPADLLSQSLSPYCRQDGQEDEVKTRREKLLGPKDPLASFLKVPLARIKVAGDRLRNLLGAKAQDAAEIHGLLAATEKRVAELHVRTAVALVDHEIIAEGDAKTGAMKGGPSDRKSWDDYREVALRRLGQALQHYRNSYKCTRDNAWALVQVLALDHVLRREESNDAHDASQRDWLQRWEVARFLSQEDCRHEDSQRRLWAHSNLAELYLLRAGESQLKPREAALTHTDAVIEAAQSFPFGLHSFRREIHRYLGFFDRISENVTKEMVSLAREIFDRTRES